MHSPIPTNGKIIIFCVYISYCSGPAPLNCMVGGIVENWCSIHICESDSIDHGTIYMTVTTVTKPLHLVYRYTKKDIGSENYVNGGLQALGVMSIASIAC